MQNSIPIIDPHLHLFDLSKGQYNWLRLENPPHWPDKHIICKNFSETDLSLPSPFELKGFVHIEAGFDNEHPWREIDWLEASCSLPFRTVAYADLTSNKFNDTLAQLVKRSSVAGIRHILQEDAQSILAHPHTAMNLAMLAEQDLCFDAQLYLHQSDNVDKLADILSNIPALRLIIDHTGLPPELQSNEYISWKLAVQRLADMPNVAIKISGWEMHNRSWQYTEVEPYIQHCLECFGEDRIMLASNFPLCLWRKPYSAFWRLYSESLPPQLLHKLLFNNAAQCYRLNLQE